MVACSFCGREMKEGEGVRLFKRDGTALNFCSRKCEKNQVKLHRNPARLKWTSKYASTAKKTKTAQGKAVEKKPEEKRKEPEKKAAAETKPAEKK